MLKRIKKLIGFKGIGFNLKTLIYLQPTLLLFAGIFSSFKALNMGQLVNIFWPQSMLAWVVTGFFLLVAMKCLAVLAIITLIKGRVGVYAMAKRSIVKYMLMISYQVSSAFLFLLGYKLIISWHVAFQRFTIASLSTPIWKTVLVPYYAAYDLYGAYLLGFVAAEVIFLIFAFRTPKIVKLHMFYLLALITIPWWMVITMYVIRLTLLMLSQLHKHVIPTLKSWFVKLSSLFNKAA